MVFGITDGTVAAVTDNGGGVWTLGTGTIELMQFSANSGSDENKVKVLSGGGTATVYNMTINTIADNSLVICEEVNGRLCVIVPSECGDLS